MKRVFYSFILLVMAAAIALPSSAPVMADSSEVSGPPLKPVPSLMIKAPGLTDVSQPVTITVFSKRDRGSIAGASVYALHTDDLVVTTDKTKYATLLSGYAATAEAKGVLIGTTGSDGTLTGKLSSAGRFLLVATKEGYIPGFTRITVTLASKTALGIRGASSVAVNEAVTFTVTARYSSKKVEGAAVFARLVTDNETLHIKTITPSVNAKVVKQLPAAASIKANKNSQGNANQLKAPVSFNSQVTRKLLEWVGENTTVIRSYPWNEQTAVNYAAEIQSGGFLLGTSDANGQVTYTLTQEGMYVLAAIKDECIPGFARTRVHATTDNTGEGNGKKRLVVKAPASASADQQITIKVLFKADGLPAENTVIYAFKARGLAFPKLKPVPLTTENGTATQILTESAALDEVNDQEVSGLLLYSAIRPVTLGITDVNGEVLYTFNEAGGYMLTAIKDGYITGGTRINILSGQSQKSLTLNATVNTTSGQPSVINVREKASSQPVSGAAVYVLKINGLTAVNPMPPTAYNSKSKGDRNKFSTANIGVSSRLTVNVGWMQNEADTAREKGTLAGYTDDKGQLSYSISSSGQYIIAAYKEGYNPGFIYITYTLPVSSTIGNSQ